MVTQRSTHGVVSDEEAAEELELPAPDESPGNVIKMVEAQEDARFRVKFHDRRERVNHTYLKLPSHRHCGAKHGEDTCSCQLLVFDEGKWRCARKNCKAPYKLV